MRWRTMSDKYRAIVDAGLILQIDDPGLATSWDMIKSQPTLLDYRRYIRLKKGREGDGRAPRAALISFRPPEGILIERGKPDAAYGRPAGTAANTETSWLNSELDSRCGAKKICAC